jgi:MFS family permease
MGYSLNDIAFLFVLGFFSSAFTGPFVGEFADKYGRRMACSLFCVIYAASCLTKLTSNYSVLMVGRLLGGVSTSLLHTTFESWLVASHHNNS